MKRIIYSAVLLAIFGVSCKKSSTTDTSGNGNGNGNNTPVANYFTTTPGANWVYISHDTITNVDTTYAVNSTNKDTTMSNSKSYHIFTSQNTNPASSTIDSLLYNGTENNYYQLAKLLSFLPTVDFNYLKTDKLINQYWDTTITANIPYNGLNIVCTATIRNKIIQKDAVITLNGNTYDSIINVRTELLNPSASVTIFGMPQTINLTIDHDLQAMYAPRHGLVKRIAKYHLTATPPAILGLPPIEMSNGKITTLQQSSIQ